MSTKPASKINLLLQSIPKGTVLLSSWLFAQGYSYDLQQKYIRGKWLTPIGKGAYIRTGDNVNIFGALCALQKQAGKTVYPGGPSSLYLHGYTQYIAMENQPLKLFTSQTVKLPLWFRKNWQGEYTFRRSTMLPPNEAMMSYNTGNYEILISSPVRAIMECLEMVPNNFDLEEAWLIMESLNALPPSQIQQLLEQCSSIKAKRLFLFFAEKAGHSWYKYLNLSTIHLGNGKRSIIKNGVFNRKYQITLPKNLA